MQFGSSTRASASWSIYPELANRASAWAASFWLLSGILTLGVHIVQRAKGPRGSTLLLGWPLLLPTGQGTVDVAVAYGSGPFLLSELASACCAAFTAPPHLSFPDLSPLFSVLLAVSLLC